MPSLSPLFLSFSTSYAFPLYIIHSLVYLFSSLFLQANQQSYIHASRQLCNVLTVPLPPFVEKGRQRPLPFGLNFPGQVCAWPLFELPRYDIGQVRLDGLGTGLNRRRRVLCSEVRVRPRLGRGDEEPHRRQRRGRRRGSREQRRSEARDEVWCLVAPQRRVGVVLGGGEVADRVVLGPRVLGEIELGRVFVDDDETILSFISIMRLNEAEVRGQYVPRWGEGVQKSGSDERKRGELRRERMRGPKQDQRGSSSDVDRSLLLSVDDD